MDATRMSARLPRAVTSSFWWAIASGGNGFCWPGAPLVVLSHVAVRDAPIIGIALAPATIRYHERCGARNTWLPQPS